MATSTTIYVDISDRCLAVNAMLSLCVGHKTRVMNMTDASGTSLPAGIHPPAVISTGQSSLNGNSNDNMTICEINAVCRFIAISEDRFDLCGRDGLEDADIQQWLSMKNILFGNEKDITVHLPKLNSELQLKTYLSLGRLTMADVVVFCSLIRTMSSLKDQIRYSKFSHVSRWYDFIQNHQGISDLCRKLGVYFALPASVPVPEMLKVPAEKCEDPTLEKSDANSDKKAINKSKKGEGNMDASIPSSKVSAPVDAASSKKDKMNGEKKEKKEKVAAAAPSPTEPEGPPAALLDIRVGLVKSVACHPDADSLYVEEIDCGDSDGNVRTVVSGLVKFILIEEFNGKLVCVLCNLKPAKMRGVISSAMVLAASNADHSCVELLTPPTGCVPGDRVFFPGTEPTPVDQLNPKKKIFETVQPDWSTNDNCVAMFGAVPFSTSKGVVTVKSITKGSIK